MSRGRRSGDRANGESKFSKGKATREIETNRSFALYGPQGKRSKH